MRQTMEQKRAAHAWKKASEGVRAHRKDYVNDAKGLPALIMNSGLLQVLAFLEGKPGRHQVLGQHLRDWLSSTHGLPRDFSMFMDAVVDAEPSTYRAIHAEAYAWLRWLRQLAPAALNAVQPKGGE